MGEAYLDWQKKGGIKLNDVIEEYRYVANGKAVKKGDFLTYVGEDVAPATEPPFNAIALSSGVGAPEFVEGEITKTGNIFPTSWNVVTEGTKYSSSDGFTLEVNSYSDSNHRACLMSDNSNSTDWYCGNNINVGWAMMTLSKPQKITKMKIDLSFSFNLYNSLSIQGKKEDDDWVDLYTTTNAMDTNKIEEITLNNTDYYLYYRLYIDGRRFVREWQTSEYIAIEQVPNTEHKDQVKIARVAKLLSSLPVGSLVKDVNSTFLGAPVIWKIADKNHEGYPKGSVTLITEKCIAIRAFDAKEPNNSDANRQNYGNNRYSVSNIRQWLNSAAEAGQWYSAQHSQDQAPNSSSYVSCNTYSEDAGFLNKFSSKFKNALLDTVLTVALNTKTDGGGSETVTDKIFLASSTEVGFANENNIIEGTLLPVFNDDTSRIAYCTAEAISDSDYSDDPANDKTAWLWWLRTPKSDSPNDIATEVRHVSFSGSRDYIHAFVGNRGVRPLCNLSSSTEVSFVPDEDGCYTLFAGGDN